MVEHGDRSDFTGTIIQRVLKNGNTKHSYKCKVLQGGVELSLMISYNKFKATILSTAPYGNK